MCLLYKYKLYICIYYIIYVHITYIIYDLAEGRNPKRKNVKSCLKTSSVRRNSHQGLDIYNIKISCSFLSVFIVEKYFSKINLLS